MQADSADTVGGAGQLATDTRPDISPYSSDVCSLFFRQQGPLRVPLQFIQKSPKLRLLHSEATTYGVSGDRIEVEDFSIQEGHVVVHFLVTGRYECLQPEGSTTQERNASEFNTAMRVLQAAEFFALPELDNLAQAEMRRLGNMLSLPVVITLIEEAKFPHRRSISKYIHARIYYFIKKSSAKEIAQTTMELGLPATLGLDILRNLIVVIGGMQAPSHALSPQDESLSCERLPDLQECCNGMEEEKELAILNSKYDRKGGLKAEDMKRLEALREKSSQSTQTNDPNFERPVQEGEVGSEDEVVPNEEIIELEQLQEKRARKGKLKASDRDRMKVLLARLEKATAIHKAREAAAARRLELEVEAEESEMLRMMAKMDERRRKSRERERSDKRKTGIIDGRSFKAYGVMEVGEFVHGAEIREAEVVSGDERPLVNGTTAPEEGIVGIPGRFNDILATEAKENDATVRGGRCSLSSDGDIAGSQSFVFPEPSARSEKDADPGSADELWTRKLTPDKKKKKMETSDDLPQPALTANLPLDQPCLYQTQHLESGDWKHCESCMDLVMQVQQINCSESGDHDTIVEPGDSLMVGWD